ncbi:MAG: hypothetical protein KQJ78_16535 [Deltaproteobacteria bacterium]|nr:hypothetical protein [Deltaproteobacteria bacterium]
MSSAETLRLGLCHLKVTRGAPELNLARVRELSLSAARAGAQIILHTELALSGYGFAGRGEMLPLALALDNPALDPLRRLCREHRCYLALGLAELAPPHGLIHNSAVLWGPDGEVQARRRKVTAEPKWAAAGPGAQPGCLADTPWGRVGLIICSENYYSLTSRGLALAGADLLLAPANWPPGDLDPCQLWRLRALENGVFLAACNRTGQDPRLDCRQALSAVFDPQGHCLAEYQGPDSQVLLVDIPLVAGRLASAPRRAALQGRRPADYPYLAHDLRAVTNITSFLELPPPGELFLRLACPPGPALAGAPELAHWLAQAGLEPGEVVVLPRLDAPDLDREFLGRAARDRGCALAAQLGDTALGWATADGSVHHFPLDRPLAGEPRLVDLGPARLGLAAAAELRHPEAAQVLAKRGCDLVLVSAGPLPPTGLDLLAGRSLDQVAVAVASPQGGVLAVTPQGHAAWQELRVGPGQCVGRALATGSLRAKTWMERVDLELLLSPEGEVQP